MADENLAERLSRLTPQQRALLRRQVARKPAGTGTIPRRANPGEPLPLSPAQLRMWFLEQLQPGTGTYHSYDYTRLTGPLDVAALEAAFREVIRRHESLRTSFREEGGVPRQVIADEVPFAIERIDLSAKRADGQKAHAEDAQAIADFETLRPFDLAVAPLMRVVLVRLGEDDHLLLMTLHHIITDGWSLGVIDREVVALYEAFRNGRPSPLPELPVQFGDVVEWLNLPEQEAQLAGQLAWWTQTLDGVPDVLDLPADRPRPAVQSFRGARLTYRLPKELTASLQEVAGREQATLFMVLLAAFQTLLYRHTGQSEFAVGTPVANRKPAETEALVGLFINTVALRARVDGDEPFRDLLRRVRDTALDAFAHQEVPFDRVVDSLALSRSAGRTPLFQTMIVFGAGQGSSTPLDGGVRRAPFTADAAPARFDLTLSMAVDEDGVECVFDYSADLFDGETMQALARRFESLLRGAANDPATAVSRLPLVDFAERARLLSAASGPARTWPADLTTLHSLFAAQAARTPDAAAIVTPATSITYAELDAWSGDIAAGIAPGTKIVALLADRSAAAIASVLGVLKAGAAYLPIDPGVPAERLAWLLADSGASLLPLPAPPASTHPVPSPRSAGRGADASIASGGVRGVAGDGDGTNGSALHAFSQALGRPSVPDDVPPSTPAYLIYTSGSTGLPKGVLVEHRSAVNLALAFAESHRFAGHRLLMIPPLPFDASVGDVFPAFATGAALVLHPAPAELDATTLARFCAEHRVTAIDAPAALWRRWTEEWIATGSDDPLPELTLMMVGGESIPTDEVRRFAKLTHGRVQFVNHYGPTEATVCATTFHTVDASGVGTTELPIGTPITNVSAHVLDRHLEPLPPGVAGELYLGGAGVARGYFGRDAETAERFIADPFSTDADARLYRTGDLARRRADGALLFLGRADRQLKLRGFRIEPGEIEGALLAHRDVRAALVIKRDERLVAYVAGIAEPRELRAFLQERLPDFMVPSAIVPLHALPLTSNGKVDLNALPAPPELRDGSSSAVAPRNEVEHALAEIWREVLGRDRVGIDDDFFALGGDSLRSMPLIFRIRQRFGIDVPLSAIFAAPTVARFGTLIAKLLDGEGVPVTDDRLESRVGAAIAPEPGAARSANLPPRAVLLTGATGFLGGFLAEELLHRTSAVVYCLVRAASAAEGLRRIEENLAAYALGGTFDPERIVPLLGDLALPRLGLDDATLAHLAETIDVIYHNGSTVNFVAPYEKLEAANVDGTREVLRLAARARLKPVHLVSTLGVHFTKPRIGRTVTEREALPPSVDVLGGYNESKWVADRVAQLARDAGIPVSIHRPARITGDSRSGALNPADLFYSWIKGCVQLGCFPDDAPVLNMAPVDHVARSIIALSLDGAAPADYHYFNNRTLPLETLVATLRDRGFPVAIVPYRTWIALLHDAIEHPVGSAVNTDGEENTLAKFLALMEEPEEGEPVFDCRATEAALDRLGIVCPPADAALLNVYLDQLAVRGFLALPAVAEGGA